MDGHGKPTMKNLTGFSRIRQMARIRLEGPRSVMFSNDPKGHRLWFEPKIRLISHSQTKTRSLAVFSTPNCLEKDSSPTLVREVTWSSRSDKEALKEGREDLPLVDMLYKTLSADQILHVDELLRNLDASLSTFRFSAEGLDLAGPSGIKPLPKEAVIVADVVHNEISRVTRHAYLELHWTPIQSELTNLDRSWGLLFEALATISESAVPSISADLTERYEIDPEKLGELFR